MFRILVQSTALYRVRRRTNERTYERTHVFGSVKNLWSLLKLSSTLGLCMKKGRAGKPTLLKYIVSSIYLYIVVVILRPAFIWSFESAFMAFTANSQKQSLIIKHNYYSPYQTTKRVVVVHSMVALLFGVYV